MRGDRGNVAERVIGATLPIGLHAVAFGIHRAEGRITEQPQPAMAAAGGAFGAIRQRQRNRGITARPAVRGVR